MDDDAFIGALVVITLLCESPPRGTPPTHLVFAGVVLSWFTCRCFIRHCLCKDKEKRISRKDLWSKIIMRRQAVEGAAYIALRQMIREGFWSVDRIPCTTDILFKFDEYCEYHDPQSLGLAHFLIEAWQDLSRELHAFGPQPPDKRIIGKEYEDVLAYIDRWGGWERARAFQALRNGDMEIAITTEPQC
eukprot:Blabericola_migrator_1__6798@NODE_343_length_9585_cov_71_071023_g276_i0_p5_GENE_NODE_343_length_9585_cov_71_071023_g276_i0NODE_343_length_9585_cov_71_071023_g276_i0_p5_ORF_typecomplete_len189_score29_50_NODE_343_length_9585_cov_71_071023_g276_i089649530